MGRSGDHRTLPQCSTWKRGATLAVPRPRLSQPGWANPVWPDTLPEPDSLRLKYGAVADELVVLFDGTLRALPVFDFIDTPDYSYAAIKIDPDTGAVLGVLVYPLAAYAVEHHPDWRAAMDPNPSPAVSFRIVADIRQLYDRYGRVPDENDAE